MSRKKPEDPRTVRTRRTVIYTFLLILIFMYISARAQLEKQQEDTPAAGMVQMEQKDPAAAGKEQTMPENTRAAGEVQTAREDTRAAGEEQTAQEDTRAAGEEQTAQDDPGELSADAAPDTGLVLAEEDMWSLYLTNAEHPVPDGYLPELKKIPGQDESVDERVCGPLTEMLEAMKAEGLSPIVCSGYRTLEKQESLFQKKVSDYLRRGSSKEEAQRLAARTISVPGSGEHCMGLAVDIYSSAYRKLEEGFENTPEGKWLQEHCQDYGFILRYDRGKEDITGIDYEPWHFRYVGKKTAVYLKETGWCLEEFYVEESLYG